MSIENNLTSIASSLSKIVDLLERSLTVAPVPVQAAPAVQAVPVPGQAAQAAPAVQAVPVPVQAAPAVQAVPVVPAFAPAVQAAPVASGVPFNDSKGLMDYCMKKYQSLGPVKGGLIQNALVELGCTNINSLQPAQYAAFYAKVEAL